MPSNEIILQQKLLAWQQSCPSARALRKLLAEEMIPAYFFGGVCRSLWDNQNPRDIDMVVDDVLWDKFKHAITKRIDLEKNPSQMRYNRFGGLKFSLLSENDPEATLTIDAWPISQTWAFANQISGPSSPTLLPETTLINVESIVALIWHPDDQDPNMEPWIFEKGFFDAMQSRTLEIQNEHTPDPALCIARIKKFEKQGWKIGESVQAFLDHHRATPAGSDEAVKLATQKHYGNG